MLGQSQQSSSVTFLSQDACPFERNKQLMYFSLKFTGLALFLESGATLLDDTLGMCAIFFV